MRSFLKSKESKNAGWIIGERVIQMLLSLIVSVLSARYLGPNNYGALSYSASLVAFFSSIASLGMEGVIIKKMIAEPQHEGEYLGGCMGLRLMSALASSATIVLIMGVLNPGDQTKMLLAFLQSLQLVFQSVNILDYWFQRYLQSKYISVAKMAASIIVMGYKVVLMLTSRSVVWFAFANSLSTLIIAATLYVFYRRSKGPSLKVDLSYGRLVLKDSYHYILSGLMVSIYGQMDKIMIGKMMTDTDVGLYSTAAAICSMWIFVPQAIIQSFRPSIMEARQSGNLQLYRKKLTNLYSVILWLCVFVSICVCVAAPLAVRILYGEAYMGAIGALRIIIWMETFSMLGTARNIWLLCEQKDRYAKYFLSIGAAANLIMNAVMIPGMGIEGAAVATLATQVITSLLAPLLFRETRVHTRIIWDAFLLKGYFEKR